MTEQQLKNILAKGLADVGHESPPLEINSVSEQAIVGRLLTKIYESFPGYILDIEYNRDLKNDTTKQAEICAQMNSLENDESLGCVTEERKIKRMRPDLIIHQRTSNGGNLAVIELKFENAIGKNKEYDILKVKAIKEKYEYSHAVTVHIPRDLERLRNMTEDDEAIKFHDSVPS